MVVTAASGIEAYREQLASDLERAGEALEEAGFDVNHYSTYFWTDGGATQWNMADDPREAFDATIEELRTADEWLEIKAEQAGDFLYRALHGDDIHPEFLYHQIGGSIDVTLPDTYTSEPMGAEQAESEAQARDIQIHPEITYDPGSEHAPNPDTSGEFYVACNSWHSQAAYRAKDAVETDIREALESAGFTTKGNK